MAAPDESSGESDTQEFDSESDYFDPLKALLSEKSIPPYQNVKIYDNVQQYEGYIKAAKKGTLRQRLEQRNLAAIQRKEGQYSGTNPSMPGGSTGVTGGASVKGGATASTATSETVTSERDELLMPGRLFTKGQAPVVGERKKLRSVLTRMEATTRGPCGRLQHFMTHRTKVKVYTRNYGRIRGVCTGYIVAFDKHWNLCLQDVDEIYQKKARRKHTFLGDPSAVPDSAEKKQTEISVSSASRPHDKPSKHLKDGRHHNPCERSSRGVRERLGHKVSGDEWHARRPGAHRQRDASAGRPLGMPSAEDPTAGRIRIRSATGADAERGRASGRSVTAEHHGRGRSGASSATAETPATDRSRASSEAAKSRSGAGLAAAEDPDVARLTAQMSLLAVPQSRRSQRRPTVETHRRHCHQLFVRGDNVVLVAALDQTSTAGSGSSETVVVKPEG